MMRLARGRRQGAVIPMTPLVDVMLILLVFFMVTSTYLDLDMIPTGGPADEAAAAPEPVAPTGRSATMLVRLDAGDRAVWRGRAMAPAALDPVIREAVAARPALRLLILPSPRASTQSLVSVLEAAERAGAAETRVLRVEGGP